MKKIGLVLLTLFTFALCSYASEKGTKSTYDKDEARRISKICAGCHGTNGAAPGETIPIIGGQKADYLKKTMAGFRDGKRAGSMMAKIAQAYDDSKVELTAKFFEEQKWVNTPAKADMKLVKKGKALASACADCHGKNGKGEGENPRIAGQPARYLMIAFDEYKNGKRGDTPEMDLIKDYKEEDLKALANYFASVK